MSGVLSPALSVTTSLIGKAVTFTSKNISDPITYTGIISGVISYEFSQMFGFDTVSYNAAVQRVDTNVGDVTALHYFVITLDNASAQPSNRLFSNEWINPGSFSVVQQTAIYNFNIYDLTSGGATQILNVLKAAGYNAVQVTDPSNAAVNQGSTTITQTT